MTLGPLVFGAPLALLGLIALPVIWWLLRATPPRPLQAELPSLRLLDDVEDVDTEPSKTPWWVLLLRLAAAALAIVGLASPTFMPDGQQTDGAVDGPVLVIVEDGWQAAQRWSDVREAAETVVANAPRDADIHIMTTAPRLEAFDPALRLSKQEATRRLASLEPVSWGSDYATTLERLDVSELEPARVVWIASGMDGEGVLDFSRKLAELPNASVRAIIPRGGVAITGVSARPNGASVEVRRLDDRSAVDLTVAARALDGSPIASATASFSAGDDLARAEFDLPTAALNRIERFDLTAGGGAASAWLWDSSAKRQRVGIVAPASLTQPLLEDVYYVRKALEPFADVSEGDLDAILLEQPDAIVLTDIGQLPVDTEAELEAWVVSGGALIRFAGPRLASQGSSLLPVALRRSTRALGGTLNWDTPQPIAPFEPGSPFAGLVPDPDARVRQQVLAQPSPDLANFTWAKLEDGSPVVTGAPYGDGTIVLFHVSAGPSWSDLSYTGLFVDMLRRSIAAGRSDAQAAEGEGSYVPQLTLDGFGQLVTPAATTAPIDGAAFYSTALGPETPPGLYRGPAGVRARNAGENAEPSAFTRWPSGLTLLGDIERRNLNLAGPLLLGALGLLLIDLVVALSVAGRFGVKRAGAATTAILAALIVLPAPADAQRDKRTKFEEAVSEMRFAYVITGDRAVDDTSREGLTGLTLTLFRRSSVEPALPHGIDLERDVLEVYPMIYLPLSDAAKPLSAEAVDNLNAYMNAGGFLIIDTRRGGDLNGTRPLEGLMTGLDTGQLVPVPENHVLTRTFYLLDDLPGRYAGNRVWIEAEAAGIADGPDQTDVIPTSRLLVGSADWAAAWAVDERGRPTRSVDGGEAQRETAKRAGINIAIYILTGTYKDDQVHVIEVLERISTDVPSLPKPALDGSGGPE